MVTNFLIRKMYLLPLEGVRGEEPSLGEGLGRSYHFNENDTNGIAPKSAV